MNETEALAVFCKQNVKLLTSKEFDRQEFKDKYRDYFYRHHKNRFGKPSSKDLQEALVAMLRKNGVAPQNIISLIHTVPFFSDAADDFKEFLLRTLNSKEYESALSSATIETIKQVGAFKALEITKGAEITAEKQQEILELNRQIETKRQEYESLPSLLDAAPVPEPEFCAEAEDVKPWWERFYLRSDPFPRKDGLSSIAEEMYEAVTTKTKPFIDILSALNRNPHHLFHTGFLLAGGYGYGKTTFIDYLSYHLIHANVLPIRLTCARCSADASGFADSFFHRLRKEMLEEARKITHVEEKALMGIEIEDQILELIRLIISHRTGIVIFMDDYHKYASHFSQIFEFLGTLQVFKDTLTRKGLPVGFMVSGLFSWKHQLRKNSQLSGFLDNIPLEMPEVSTELICEVFNKRIRAYCYEGTPRLIKPAFVDRLVREFEGKAGLRDYITKIVYELSHNNYAIVDSPVEIDGEKLAAIKALLEADPNIKTGISKLVVGSMFKRFSHAQIAKALELIVHIGIQNGITETDKEFAANRFYFQTLRDCGLIQKQRGIVSSRLAWGLHSKLRVAVSEVTSKFNLHLYDYLLKIYAYKDYNVSQVNAGDDVELSQLAQFFGNPKLKLETATADNIGMGLRALESLSASRNTRRRDSDEVGKAYAAFEAFSTALFTVDTASTYFRRLGVKDLALEWAMHPFNEQVISEAMVRHSDYLREKTPQKQALALKQLTEAATTIAHMLKSQIQQQTESTQSVSLYRPLAHCEDELEILRAISEGAYSTRAEDHFEYVRKTTDWLELRMRSFFYLTGYLLFGQNYLEQCPRGVVQYAYKNLDARPNLAGVENHFDGLTRSQFRQILCEGNPYKEMIVDYLRLGWKQSDWALFGELFAETNIETAHLQVSAFDVTKRGRYSHYCSMAEELMAAMNELASQLAEQFCYLRTIVTDKPKEQNFFVRFCFKHGMRLKEFESGRVCSSWPKGLGSSPLLCEHAICGDALSRVRTRLHDKMDHSPGGIIIIDILNVNYMAEHFRASVVEVITSLVFLAHVERSVIAISWMGSSVALSRNRTGSG